MKKNIWIAALALIVLAAMITGILVMEKTATITVIHPMRGPAIQAVYATGTVEASVMFPVAPRLSARLVALLSDEGQAVEKGQVLARLEDNDLQKTLTELRAKADLAQKEYDRRQPLATSGVVSRETLDKVKADLDMAVAAVERAQVNLDYMKLVAPEAGIVIRRDGEIGELIPANQPVFWLACCGNLRIEGEVDEEDISLVKAGQKAVISADAFPDMVFDGVVQAVTPKGDPVSRSYRVRIDLTADTKLMIGMTAETNIIIRETPDALLLPASAISDNSAGVIEDNKIIVKKVETGAQTPAVTEIRSGLAENDLVILDREEAGKARKSIKYNIQDWKAP